MFHWLIAALDHAERLIPGENTAADGRRQRVGIAVHVGLIRSIIECQRYVAANQIGAVTTVNQRPCMSSHFHQSNFPLLIEFYLALNRNVTLRRRPTTHSC